MKTYHIYFKYWDILTPYHVPKIKKKKKSILKAIDFSKSCMMSVNHVNPEHSVASDLNIEG